MRYRYLDDFRRGISVFALFSYGIAVLGTPPMSPSCIEDQSCVSTSLTFRAFSKVSTLIHKENPRGKFANSKRHEKASRKVGNSVQKLLTHWELLPKSKLFN